MFFGPGSGLAFVVLRVDFWVDNTKIRDCFIDLRVYEHT
jgi:hypothetical protein